MWLMETEADAKCPQAVSFWSMVQSGLGLQMGDNNVEMSVE